MIDPRAAIHSTAKIADDVSIGPFSIIGEQVSIDSGTVIGPHAIIEKNTRIGKHNKILQYASLGSDPQHTGYHGEETWLEIGDHNIFREFVTINRGTVQGPGVTRIGDHNFFMSCSHVAHDCLVNNYVIFANTASIAGHVQVMDHAILGAFAGVHQYVKIGAYSFLGRATKIYQDVLPYMLMTGNPGIPSGINAVGLRRHGFSQDTLRELKKAFFIICKRGLKLEEIKSQLVDMQQVTAEVGILLEAINQSERGIAR